MAINSPSETKGDREFLIISGISEGNGWENSRIGAEIPSFLSIAPSWASATPRQKAPVARLSRAIIAAP